MPNSVSRYIVDYFVSNADVLLSDTNVRTPTQNAKRTAAYRTLITKIHDEFGYDVSERKIRNHFDHVRSKVISKGMTLRKGFAAEKKYRSRTGGGLSISEETRFSRNNDSCLFETPAEEKLWSFFENTPVTTPFVEGESHVGKRNSPAREGNRGHEEEPLMVDFESDTDLEEEDYGAGTDRQLDLGGGGGGGGDARAKMKNRLRVTEADLLQEQYRLIQDQRKFLNEMIHTLHVMCDFIASQKSQTIPGVEACRQSAGGRAAPITGDENVEESVISSHDVVKHVSEGSRGVNRVAFHATLSIHAMYAHHHQDTGRFLLALIATGPRKTASTILYLLELLPTKSKRCSRTSLLPLQKGI
ncbi:unnamed protein product [Cylicocyclus nassatus]|uniref:Uncharacterized protein n=1 Tax=Cylicocyclus nassatus TaxID=53992 RepID=A0AA36DKG9_CYLNA|nr:unnamed protein product [Cylicocyclus nassatus]